MMELFTLFSEKQVKKLNAVAPQNEFIFGYS